MENRTPDRVSPLAATRTRLVGGVTTDPPAAPPGWDLGSGRPRTADPERGLGAGKTVVKAGPAGLRSCTCCGRGFRRRRQRRPPARLGVDRIGARGRDGELGSGSAELAWTDEVSGRRKIVWLDRGDGMDAARILLGRSGAHLRSVLGRPAVSCRTARTRSADSRRPGRGRPPTFPALFAQYVADRAEAADEPIATTASRAFSTASWSNSSGF